MIKKIITLFKIGRTLALSDALGVIYKVHKPPAFIRFIFNLLSIRFSKKKLDNSELSDVEKLCNSILDGEYIIQDKKGNKNLVNGRM